MQTEKTVAGQATELDRVVSTCGENSEDHQIFLRQEAIRLYSLLPDDLRVSAAKDVDELALKIDRMYARRQQHS